jgi:predicted nucleic acid-binding protein
MILYLDTGALVKLYVDELMTDAVKEAVEGVDAVATSLLAYAEARAAFARARREARLSVQSYRSVVDAFAEDWDRYVSVEVTDVLVKEAGRLAESRALRGYDALHLASALSLRSRLTAPVSFLAFDQRLMTAAKREGLSALSLKR